MTEFTTHPDTTSAGSIGHRIRVTLSALLASLAAMAGLTLAATPASAATGTTYLQVCATNVAPAVRPHATVTAQWDSTGHGNWVTESQVRLFSGDNYGCGWLTLVHNGYWRIYTASYVYYPANCERDEYGYVYAPFVKQTLPQDTGWNVAIPYLRSTYC